MLMICDKLLCFLCCLYSYPFYKSMMVHQGLFHTGRAQIIQWTKESLREKPFSTAKGKIWTMTPSFIPLENIYTQLNLLQKERGISDVKKVPLSGISQLFQSDLINSASSRILVTGMSETTFSGKVVFCHILIKMISCFLSKS